MTEIHKAGHSPFLRQIVWVWCVIWCSLGVPNVVEGGFPVPSARIAIRNLDTFASIRTVTEKSNHEVVLTSAPRPGSAYVLECNASYPVGWSYLGEGVRKITHDRVIFGSISLN